MRDASTSCSFTSSSSFSSSSSSSSSLSSSLSSSMAASSTNGFDRLPSMATAKAAHDSEEMAAGVGKGGKRRRKEAGQRRDGGQCRRRRVMTAKRWRTESAKAGHDAEERRDSDEERRDDVEKRRDSEDVVVNDVDDAKGLGTQRWSWLVEESKSCAATKSGA